MNILRKNLIVPLFVGTALLSLPAWADIASSSGDCVSGNAETTPSSSFTALESGAVVHHETTGLEWRRCPEGMSWSDSECTGSAQTFTWQAALQHADTVDGWRLPNINELRSIVERCRVDPAINQQVFPNTPSLYFRSASPSAGGLKAAWNIDFFGGGDGSSSKSSPGRVRLVRGGQ